MNNKNKIDMNRQRIALAYIDFCQRHYGGKWADVVVSKRKGVRVELTQQSVEALMKEFIEEMLRGEFGISAGQEQITKSYDAMLTHEGKLTPLGATAMEEMMADVVAYKLQNPKSTFLQIVPPAPQTATGAKSCN